MGISYLFALLPIYINIYIYIYIYIHIFFFQGKSEELLVAFVKYLHQQLGNKIYNIDDVKNVIIIKTNKGFKSPSQGDTIYISHHYGNPINLEKDLPCMYAL